MSYRELLAASEKDERSRKFCNLVDYAAMLHEEEEEEEEKHRKGKSKCHMKTKKKTLSEEEGSDKRIIFNFVTRKRRTLVTRRNPQPNLIKPSSSSSSSSSFLLHLNTIAADSEIINPQNPQNPCSSSSLFLGDYKNAAMSEKMKMVRNPQNPCSSSSSLFFGGYKIVAESGKTKITNPQNPCSSSSLFLGGYKNAAESEKMEMVTNPQNPCSSSSLFLGRFKIAAMAEKMEVMTNQQNPSLKSSSSSSCLTENTRSKKRRAMQEKNPNPVGQSKKAKVETFSWKGKETPEWLNQLMQDMNGTELKLIFERTLFTTDVNPGQSRLSMPSSELIRRDFLTPVETRIIEEDIDNDKKIGVGSILVDHRNVKWGVIFKRWEMKSGSWNYTLTCGWNEIVKANGLKQGDSISVWSFRCREVLCFALLLPPSSVTQSSSVSE